MKQHYFLYRSKHRDFSLSLPKALAFFIVFICFLTGDSFAEGSRNLYPSGAKGYRAYLMSTTESKNWNPFATEGLMRVWVQPGETIYAGSSVHGFRRHNDDRKVGEIILRSPNGTEYRSLNSTHNPTDGGLIKDRREELAGPNTGASSDGYKPFTRKVAANEGGIWEIRFVSLGDNTNIPSNHSEASPHPTGTWNGIRYNGSSYDGNYLANENWVQPLAYGNNNHVALIAAWDVSVGKREAPAQLIPGRLFTTVFAGTLPNSRFNERAFYSKFYVLTPGGYAFLVDNNGQNGASFNFFSNDKGIHQSNNPNTPSYQSLNSSTLADLQNRTRDPRQPDATPLGSENVTNKLFFDKPAADLPAKARVRYGAGREVETWLKNPNVVPPAILGLNLACGGTITFNSTVSGGYKVLIDTNNDGNFEGANDRVLTGSVQANNPVSILWDGKDNGGRAVVAGARIKIKVVVTAGEIHFPYSDVESNLNGIVIAQLKADGSYEPTDNYTVYWDDTNLGASANSPSPLFNNADGLDSRTNGHKWGGNPSQTNESSYFGNNRTIDTWAYVIGSSEALEIVTCGLSLSGYVFNDTDGLDDGMVDNNNGRDQLPEATRNQLYATLLDKEGEPIASTPVGKGGDYQFGNLLPNQTYRVVIATSPNRKVPSLPTDRPWVNTGEFVGTGVGNDGKVDGILDVPVGVTSVSNANFGIQYKLDIAGNVWHDINGDAARNGDEKPVSGNNNDNGGASTVAGTVYANLVDYSGNVVRSVAVNTDGTYAFNEVSGGTRYKVILTETQKSAGTTLLDNEASIPQGWQATGVNTPQNGSDNTNKTNVIDLGLVEQAVSGIDFGIQQPPLTDDSFYVLEEQPASGTRIPLNGTVRGKGDNGETEVETPIASDPEKSTLTLVVTTPIVAINGVASGGVPVLYYEGREVNEFNFPGLRIPNYIPDRFTVEINGTGYKGISFKFKVIDAAGAESNVSEYGIVWENSLPVKWKSIDVREENSQAVLTWSTTEELNVSHFEVQYTRDGQTWRTVSNVEAKNREAAAYSYVHGLSDRGVHYFRVRSIDLDGSSSLSTIVSLKGGNKSAYRIYPNPVTGGVLTLDVPMDQIEKVSVYQLTGSEVRNLRVTGNQLDVRNLSTGQYLLRITDVNGETFVKTFIVQ